MKIATIADIHAGGKRLDDCARQLDAALQAMFRAKVSVCLIPGDIFNCPEIGDGRAETGAVGGLIGDWFGELRQAGIQVVAIPGNHDMRGAGGVDALRIFDSLRGVTTIRRPRRQTIENVVTGEALYIFAMPWSWAGGDADATATELLSCWRPTDTPSVFLSHVEVVGGRMSRAHACATAGGKWQMSRATLSALPVDHVALGHFHLRQDLTDGRGGFNGALLHRTFGEAGNPQGFEMWDTATGAVEWIELSASPPFKVLRVEVGDPAPDPSEYPDFRLRVEYARGALPVEDVRQLANAGVDTIEVVEAVERVHRAAIPADAIGQPGALYRQWAVTREPRQDDGEIAADVRVLEQALAGQTGANTTTREEAERCK